MAFLGRINGPMLKDNLERQGVDLSFETDLLYLDVNNDRVGINTAMPSATLTLVGNALLANIGIANNTISSQNLNGNIDFNLNGTGKLNVNYLTTTRIPFLSGNSLIDDPNLTFDGSNLTVTGNISVTNDIDLGNININNTTVSTTVTNANLILSPNGTGKVNISYLTANAVAYTDANNNIVNNSNLQYDGSNLSITGNIVFPNLVISDGTLTSPANISITPVGKVIVTNLNVLGAGFDSLIFTDGDGDLKTNSNFTVDDANSIININEISFIGGVLASNQTNGNISLMPDGLGVVVLDTDKAVVLPVGGTADRPSPATGMFRFNTTTSSLEYYNGITWLVVPNTTNVITSDIFTGDGSTTSFTLSRESSTTETLVSINGTVQKPTVSYTVSTNVITFTEAPLSSDVIEVRILTSLSGISTITDGNTKVIAEESVPRVTVRVSGSNVAYFNSNNVTFNSAIASVNYIQKVQNITGATGIVVHNCNNGTYFNHTSIVSDFTLDLTNLYLPVDHTTSIKLMLHQGATAYLPTAIKLGASYLSINWLAWGSITGNANKIDVVNFDILNAGSGTYHVTGRIETFG